MLKRRVTFQLEFSVDLDPVPGWGFEPQDWKDYIKVNLSRDSHYNPEILFKGWKVKTK